MNKQQISWLPSKLQSWTGQPAQSQLHKNSASITYAAGYTRDWKTDAMMSAMPKERVWQSISQRVVIPQT